MEGLKVIEEVEEVAPAIPDAPAAEEAAAAAAPEEKYPVYPPEEIPFELLDFDDVLPVIVAEPAVNCANPELASTAEEIMHSIYVNCYRRDLPGKWPRYVVEVEAPNMPQDEEHHYEKLSVYVKYMDIHHTEETLLMDELPLTVGRKVKTKFVIDLSMGLKLAVRGICNQHGIWESCYAIPEEWGIDPFPYVDPID
ncbi:MAG: hypothetical protein IJH83_08760 [Coriobacteriales bacterium]|nr:hypothetical protein [Coriobacteriales bacterium]